MDIKSVEAIMLLAIAILCFTLIETGVTTSLNDNAPVSSSYATITATITNNEIVFTHRRGALLKEFDILLNGSSILKDQNFSIGNEIVLPYQLGFYSMIDLFNNELVFYGEL